MAKIIHWIVVGLILAGLGGLIYLTQQRLTVVSSCMSRYDCERIATRYQKENIDFSARIQELERRLKDNNAALLMCRENQDTRIYEKLHNEEGYYQGIYDTCLAIVPMADVTTCNRLISQLYSEGAHNNRNGGFIWPPGE